MPPTPNAAFAPAPAQPQPATPQQSLGQQPLPPAQPQAPPVSNAADVLAQYPPDASTGGGVGSSPGPDSSAGASSTDTTSASPQPSQDFDPSKSPSEQLGHDGSGGDNKSDPHSQGASGITKLPIKGLKGPLPAIALGVIVLIFLITLALYAFLG